MGSPLAYVTHSPLNYVMNNMDNMNANMNMTYFPFIYSCWDIIRGVFHSSSTQNPMIGCDTVRSIGSVKPSGILCFHCTGQVTANSALQAIF